MVTKYDPIEHGVTQSLLSCFINCRQHAQFMIDGWDFPRSKAALVFGTLFHWLIEQKLIALSEKKAPPKFSALEKKWFEKNPPSDTENADEMEEHIAMASALWDAYCKHWRVQDEKRIEWVSLESEFNVEHPGTGVPLRGKRDGLLRFRRDKKGKLWLLETKTASRIDESTLEESLGFNFQNLFYTIATELEVGEKIGGILYNIIRKPQLQRGNATLPEFHDRMKEDVEKRPEFYFYRAQITLTEKRKEAFRKELTAKLNNFCLWIKGKVPTYRNECACISRWKCEFLSACSSLSTRGYTKTRELFSELEG